MNQLKNGTMIVVVATIIAAVLILMTGLDDTSIKTSEPQLEGVAESETTTVDDSLASETTVKPISIESEEIKIDNSSENDTETIAQKVMSSADGNNDAIAPKGPYKEATSKTEVSQVEIKDNEVPLDNSEAVKNKNTKKEAPVIFIEPNTVVATSEQHEVLNHIVQPIWMDQKLGDFKSIEKGEVIFKLMPSSANGLQGENPKQVVTSKNGKVSPSTVSADYNYQQMPMYNGGYYIAPMPSYLMPSMLPGKAILKSKQAN